jgi:hypothetical protein
MENLEALDKISNIVRRHKNLIPHLNKLLPTKLKIDVGPTSNLNPNNFRAR